MDKIESFFKDVGISFKSWGLVITILCSSVFYVANDGTLPYKVWGIVFWIGLSLYTIDLIFSKKSLSIWSLFRGLGIICLFFSFRCIPEFGMKRFFLEGDEKWKEYFIQLFLIGLVLIFFSECLIYLGKLSKMTCPLCLGKGFVDCSDFNRLGMKEEGVQGYCYYCGATGRVEEKRTKEDNPRDWLNTLYQKK